MTPEMPIPQGKYVPATRYDNIIFTAGMTPRKNGVLISTEAVRADVPVEAYREAVTLAAQNALLAASGRLEAGESIVQLMQLNVYIRTEQGFTLHAKIADLATDYLVSALGPAGVCARTSVGVATLPGNAPVEIQLTAIAGNK